MKETRKRKPKEKRIKGFTMAAIIYAASLALVFAILISVLCAFLYTYENNLPIRKAEDFVLSLDRETLMTIQCFFENNLNVSETSRKLFVHRNTLVYRLEKIYKLTGLDLRKFDQAIVFKVAMMVHKYLASDSMKI